MIEDNNSLYDVEKPLTKADFDEISKQNFEDTNVPINNIAPQNVGGF